MIQFIRNLFRPSRLILVDGVIRVIPETDECPPTRFWMDSEGPLAAIVSEGIPRVGQRFEAFEVRATELERQPGRFEVVVRYRPVAG